MEELDSRAIEQSTFPITMSFTDDTGTAVNPDTLFWTLIDINGNVINNRENVEISNPTSTQTITLSGDDLAIDDKTTKERILLVKGTYTSDLGSDLPIRKSLKFFIDEFFEIPEKWEPVIITLSEVRSLLQIESTDNSKDENIKVLIPLVQDWIKEYCNNNFEVKGVSIPYSKVIHFENDDVDTPEIHDDNLRFADEGFQVALTANSVTGTGIAFVDGGASKDSVTDTGNGFLAAGFKKGMKFAVLGSASNDGIYTALSVTAGVITVATGSFTAEEAGENITITHGIDVRIDGSKRNDGLYKVKKVTSGRLYLFDDEILIDEKKGSLVSISIITGTKFPDGLKMPVAKLIGYSLSQKDAGIESEKLGDYSVKFRTDYPESLLRDLEPWKLGTISISTTTEDVADVEEIVIETELQ